MESSEPWTPLDDVFYRHKNLLFVLEVCEMNGYAPGPIKQVVNSGRSGAILLEGPEGEDSLRIISSAKDGILEYIVEKFDPSEYE